jgi:hypothetical protein
VGDWTFLFFSFSSNQTPNLEVKLLLGTCIVHQQLVETGFVSYFH